MSRTSGCPSRKSLKGEQRSGSSIPTLCRFYPLTRSTPVLPQNWEQAQRRFADRSLVAKDFPRELEQADAGSWGLRATRRRALGACDRPGGAVNAVSVCLEMALPMRQTGTFRSSTQGGLFLGDAVRRAARRPAHEDVRCVERLVPAPIPPRIPFADQNAQLRARRRWARQGSREPQQHVSRRSR